MASKTIGQFLKAKRTALSLSLSNVEEMTNIQRSYIIALEQDDWQALPGDFYVKAYLKQYADKLELDAQQVLQAYERQEPIEVEEPDDYIENYRFIKPSHRTQAPTEDEGITWRHYVPIYVLSAVALVIIAVVGYIVWTHKPTSPNLAKSYQISSDSPSTPSSSSSEAAPPPQNQVAITGGGDSLEVAVTEAVNPLTLTVTAPNDQETWLAITNSDLDPAGITLTQETASVTTQLHDKAAETSLSLGKVAGVTLKIGDTPVDLTKLAGPTGLVQIKVTYKS